MISFMIIITFMVTNTFMIMNTFIVMTTFMAMTTFKIVNTFMIMITIPFDNSKSKPWSLPSFWTIDGHSLIIAIIIILFENR